MARMAVRVSGGSTPHDSVTLIRLLTSKSSVVLRGRRQSRATARVNGWS